MKRGLGGWLVLAGLCVTAAAPAPAQAPAEQLSAIVDEYLGLGDDEPTSLRAFALAESPQVSLRAARTRANRAGALLARLERLDATALSHNDWLTRAMLRWDLRLQQEGAEFYWLDIPVAPYSSPFRFLLGTFAGHRFADEQDLQPYLDALHQVPPMAAAIEAKLRGQVQRGIVLPRAQIDQVVPFVRSFAAPSDRSVFAVAPSRLEAIAEPARATFQGRVRDAIARDIQPALEALASFIDSTYRAEAADRVGIGQYPGGDAFYRHLVRRHTGLDLTPQQIHEIGLEEVASLERQLDDVRRQAGFAGTLAEFRQFLKSDARFKPATPEQIGERLLHHHARIRPLVDAWFLRQPEAPGSVKRLDPGLEASLTYGYYQRPTDADRSGYYLYNASQLAQRSLLNAAALVFHELVPGHHFQIALANENRELSRFRRTTMNTAFVEGWAEYASDLAGEMGLYRDPYDRAGRIAMDLFLSTRLVVDTGMNALGWSRERAMQFMRDHTLESEEQIRTESLRYSADMPGQALAYKMGSRKIRELRRQAEAALGAKFDIRKFHQAVLGYGALPLGVLEEHVEWWIKQETGGRRPEAASRRLPVDFAVGDEWSTPQPTLGRRLRYRLRHASAP